MRLCITRTLAILRLHFESQSGTKCMEANFFLILRILTLLIAVSLVLICWLWYSWGHGNGWHFLCPQQQTDPSLIGKRVRGLARHRWNSGIRGGRKAALPCFVYQLSQYTFLTACTDGCHQRIFAGICRPYRPAFASRRTFLSEHSRRTHSRWCKFSRSTEAFFS